MNDPRDRRRERRKDFVADSTIEVIAPPEYVGPCLLKGETVNITEHGVMVTIPGLRKDIVDRWQHAVDQDLVILVQITLCKFPALPLLKGQIVWTYWKDDPEEGSVCQLGLLFQILSDKDMESLQGLLAGIITQSDG